MSTNEDRVEALLAKGVTMALPATVEIAPEVDLDRISGDGVVIHPGCRVRGASTVLSAGVRIGREGPVTVESCQLGPSVELKGGYAAKSVFLAGASLGLGHHVREGSILEEEASGAHTVGLKQTILFPFVTLGSLINFCDAFMAGGTSRSDHSEVGSSYIHFNFTPAGDKTTPSRFGDVPRGVMLREHPIFLGGQGGAVGPVTVGYGSVVGAGSVLRRDIDDEDTLRVVAAPGNLNRPFTPDTYARLYPLVARNVSYLAHLDALEQWYRQARRPFFAAQELGEAVYEGALVAIAAARSERITRLRKLARKLSADNPAHEPMRTRVEELVAVFGPEVEALPPLPIAEHLKQAAGSVTYLEAVRGLDNEQAQAGTAWLQAVVDGRVAAAEGIIPELA